MDTMTRDIARPDAPAVVPGVFIGWFGPAHIGWQPVQPSGWTMVGHARGGVIAWREGPHENDWAHPNCVIYEAKGLRAG